MAHEPRPHGLLPVDELPSCGGGATRRRIYDTQNRLVKAEGAGGTEQYRYDHKNLRIWKQNADGTETFSFYEETEESL